jgi:TRAP-type C4-dicarboxylate transport system permease small subunit
MGAKMFTKALVKFLEVMLMTILGIMVILVFGNVVLRYGFNSGITFSEEVSRFLFVWMVFLGAVLMLRDNGHLGVHTVTKLLPLWGKKVCKLVSDVTVLACCVLLTVGGWQIVALNMTNIAPISEIPLGVVYMACLFCSVGMGILLLGSIYRLLTGQMSEQEMCPDFDDAL